MEKQWRPVVYRGDPLPYEISEYGDVRRVAGIDCIGRNRKSRTIRAQLVGKYWQVVLQLEKKRYMPTVHGLVALAFLPPPPLGYGRGKIGVNHKDCDRDNNHYSNLEWATPQQNSDHAAANDLFWKGEQIHTAKLTEGDVLTIRRRKAAGEGRNALAREYDVSNYAIYAICIRKTWKHV